MAATVKRNVYKLRPAVTWFRDIVRGAEISKHVESL